VQIGVLPQGPFPKNTKELAKMIWDSVTSLLKKPFFDDLDTEHLFWLVGAVIVIAALWAFVFHRLLSLANEA
jgi:hypothetical protein